MWKAYIFNFIFNVIIDFYYTYIKLISMNIIFKVIKKRAVEVMNFFAGLEKSIKFRRLTICISHFNS